MYRLMRPLLVLLLSLVFGIAVPGDGARARPAEHLETALADVRAMVEAAPEEWGLVVAVTDRERMRMVATHGYADIERRLPVSADTRFAIGSISKSFAAITLLQLADEGRFDPSVPIARYLPDFRPRTAFPPITGHALLTHTSGLPNYLHHVASMHALIAELNAFEPGYAPGAHFWYSNAGYQLLGYAAERIEGQPYSLVLQRRILDRLGMTATEPQIDDRLRGRLAKSYVRSPDGRRHEAPWFDYLSADGAIVSTAADMGSYARMLLARGNTPSGRLISPGSFQRFATPALERYGYGIDVLDQGRVLAHSGSIAGFQAYLSADLHKGLAVVFLSNGPIDRALRDRIVDRLSRGAGGPASNNRDVGPKPLPDAASFAGRFIGRTGKALELVADAGGRLTLLDEGTALPLTRLARDVWGAYLTRQGPRTFFFFRDTSGAVTDISDGTSSYVVPGAGQPPIDAPAVYLPLIGRYMMHGEEGPSVRIFARHGRLFMAYADSNAPPTALQQEGASRFRFADPSHAPERLSFDSMIGGQAQRLTLSGVPLHRIALP